MHYTPDAAAAPIMDAFFKEREKHFATQHHIDSFDDLLGTRLRAIVRSMNPITMVREDPNTKTKHTVKVYVGGDEKLRPDHDVHIGDPTPTLPSQARIANQTYGADIFADVHVVYPDDNDETRDFERVHIGFMPIMIHSKACSLRGLNPHQLRARGECPYDMGGYFVIDGREKVIVTQEERVPNRLYTRRGEKIEYDNLILKAFIRCVSTDARDVFPRTSVFRVMTSGEITATVTHINEGAVPVTTLFRALGIESDRAILKTIFHEDPGEERNKVEIAFMHASIAAGHKSGVSSQRGAIDFLIPRTRFKSQLDLKSVLTDDLFPNVGRTFEAKAIALGEVVRHLVRAALGKEPMSELDHYANKRLMCSGAITANLFRDAYLLSIATTLRTLNEEFLTGPWRVANDIHTLVNEANLKNIFQPRIIREALVRALKGSRRGDDNARAPVQELSRVSYLGYISHMRRVNNPVDRNVKIADTHRLRPSHWGVICPVESPDGPNVGLLTHLATLVTISLAIPEPVVQETIRPAIDKYTRHLSNSTLSPQSTAVHFNDTWIAITDTPKELVDALRKMRTEDTRLNTLGVTWDVWRNDVAIRTDAGRCCRPLRRVQEGKVVPINGDPSWTELIRSGAIEMIDVEEVATCLVAMNEADVNNRDPIPGRYTHAEIHAGSTLSMVSNTYPLLNHNNGAYNSLCLAQFKQALGTTMTSIRDRFDTNTFLLHHAQRPLVSTSFADRLFGGRFAHGENVVVAIATYTGYNQDDAIIINLDAVQRGRLALTVFETIRYEESEEEPEDPNIQKTKNQIVFANPQRLVSRGYALSTTTKTTTKEYSNLDEHGMPKINKMLREGDAVVGMVKVPSTAAKEDVFTDASQRLQSRESDLPTYVDGVHLQNIDQNTAKDNALPQLRACKVRLRQMRSPELGDKLSSRYGQKGVVGMILPAVDMPFCAEDGIVPDIIINPNAFPNRRTVSHILEAVLAREGAVKGARMNADTFGGEDIGAALTQLGLRENGHGNMLMHNGRSGEEAKTRIFVGVNYYGRLKHMVEDKYQSRARGAVDATTRQPTKSKGQSGGLRIGEMEQNALIAHGLASFTREAFMQRSDHHSTKVNATSGTPAEWWAAAREDPEGPDDEATVETPYTFTLMQHELRALGVEAALLTSTDEFYL